jgi:hypothetical protein
VEYIDRLFEMLRAGLWGFFIMGGGHGSEEPLVC